VPDEARVPDNAPATGVSGRYRGQLTVVNNVTGTNSARVWVNAERVSMLRESPGYFPGSRRLAAGDLSITSTRLRRHTYAA